MTKRRPNGDGMIRKREDGRWEGRIVVGHKDDGKPIYKSVLAKTQKELIPKLNQLKETYTGVELTENSRMTLGEWLDKWLNEYKTPVLRSSTVHSYRNHIENHIKPHLGDKVITQVTTADVQKKFQPHDYSADCNDKYAPRIQANCKFKMAVSLPGERGFAERPHVVPETVVNDSRSRRMQARQISRSPASFLDTGNSVRNGCKNTRRHHRTRIGGDYAEYLLPCDG